MITAGIDVGAKTVKVVIVQDDRILGQAVVPAGYDVRKSLEAAWAEALPAAGVDRRRIEGLRATGAGRRKAAPAGERVTEATAAARGAFTLDNRTRTVVDVGAEEARAVKLDGNGRVLDFAVNEKCAAGTGAFTEALARALEVDLEELGPLSLQSTAAVAMNAQCVVFAESELVTLVHARTPRADIARAVHDAMADRIASLVRRVGLEPQVMLIGGLARNPGLVDSLRRELGSEIIVPATPEIIGAYGAALLAAGR